MFIETVVCNKASFIAQNPKLTITELKIKSGHIFLFEATFLVKLARLENI